MVLWGKKAESNFSARLKDTIDEPPVDQRIELLELEIAWLKTQLKETQKKLAIIERLAYKTGDQELYHKLSENEGICQAFDQGKSLVEIAKQFNKGKGEIELILNLRNLK